ncbi:MAG TPA: O-antigen ligase family protein [Burkholderiales bacterium]|nr:O-antigen ligase family protein [Burkholderiales bacterium]
MNAHLHWQAPHRARSALGACVYYAAGPLLCGMAIAAAVAFDPLLTRSLVRRLLGGWSTDAVPGMLAAAWLVAAVAGTALAVRGRDWFAERGPVYIVLLFVPTQFVGVSIGTLEPTKFGLLIVGYFITLELLARQRELRMSQPVAILWIAIVMCAVASVVNGLVTSIANLYSICAKVVMFTLVVNVVRDRRLLEFAIKLVIGLGLFSAVFALLQEAVFYFYKIPLTLDPNAPKYWFKETPFGTMIRASAFHPISQNLAHSLLIATAFVLFCPYRLRFKLLAFTLMASAMFFTFTGNAMIVLCGVLLIVPLVKFPHRALHYVAAVTVIGIALYEVGLFGWVYDKLLMPLSANSAQDRISLMQLGIEVLERDPWIGIGLNNFSRVSPQPVHNAFLQLASEIGLVGGVLLVALMVTVGARLATAVSRETDPRCKAMGKGVLVGYIALGAHFMFEPFINSMVSWAYIGLAEATAMVLLVSYRRTQHTRQG